MKKEWADKWVKALRSGEFKQGKSSLKNSLNEYCCLGVLCEITKQNNWGNNGFLPEQVRDFTEMKTNSGIYKNVSSLANLNDSGSSFEEIADIIEKKWENL